MGTFPPNWRRVCAPVAVCCRGDFSCCSVFSRSLVWFFFLFFFLSFFFTTLVLLLIIEKDNNTTTLASYKTRYIILLSKDQEDQEEDQEDQEDGEPGSGGDAERATGEERERGASCVVVLI